jgi:hypothetical protein
MISSSIKRILSVYFLDLVVFAVGRAFVVVIELYMLSLVGNRVCPIYQLVVFSRSKRPSGFPISAPARFLIPLPFLHLIL